MGLFGNRQQRIYNRCKWWEEVSHWPNGASDEDLAGCVDKAFGRTATGGNNSFEGVNTSRSNLDERVAPGGGNNSFEGVNTSRSNLDERVAPGGGTSVFDERGEEISPKFLSVRYSDSDQQTSTEKEARNRTVKFFAFVIIAVLAIKFASK